MANIEFSAPEQINNQYDVTQAADIYSMAQVMYWYVFGTINRGTGAKCISQEYKWKKAYIYDQVISRALRNDPLERFQSIDDIRDFIDNESYEIKEIDSIEDMRKFHRAVLSVVPEFYNHPFVIRDKSIMCELFNSIFSNNYNRSLEFNAGIGNNDIHSIIKLGNDEFLMDYNQLNILNIWGYLTDDIYDDILLLEIGESLPYIIDGKEYNHVAVIENEYMVPYDQICSGYVRYKGNVQKVSDLNIQERIIGNYYKVIAVAPFNSCTIIRKNDNFFKELQNKKALQEDDILKLKNKIHRNRADEISMRL